MAVPLLAAIPAVIGAIGSLASLFSSPEEPPTVLDPGPRPEGPAPVSLGSVQAAPTNSIQAPQPQPIMPLPSSALAWQPSAAGGMEPFYAAGATPVPTQNSLAGFFSRPEVDLGAKQLPTPEQDLLSLARNTKGSPIRQPDSANDLVSLARSNQYQPDKQLASVGKAANVAKAPKAAAQASQSAAAAKAASAAPSAEPAAAAAAGAGSEKFLGLSGGQWQGIGAATGILAQLFKGDNTPAQILQISSRGNQGPPPVSLSSIPTIQSRG